MLKHFKLVLTGFKISSVVETRKEGMSGWHCQLDLVCMQVIVNASFRLCLLLLLDRPLYVVDLLPATQTLFHSSVHSVLSVELRTVHFRLFGPSTFTLIYLPLDRMDKIHMLVNCLSQHVTHSMLRAIVYKWQWSNYMMTINM